MKQIHVSTRAQWRRWLARNHREEKNGIWLVFYKKASGSPTLDYEEAVEEALCFGWIDSVIRRMDDDQYCRKFTPRRKNSQWSSLNRRRAEKMIKAGRMTRFGSAQVKAAKKSGIWKRDPTPVINLDPPRELSEALAQHQKAKSFFEKLAPTYRKQFIGWIVTAKRPEIRARRIKESLGLLARGRKLGLK